MVCYAANGEEISRKRDVAANQTCCYQMTAKRAHLISLLHGLNACRIRAGFEPWSDLLCTCCLDDEIGSGSWPAAPGIPSSRPETIAGPAREFSNALHEVVLFDIRVERLSRTDPQRDFTAGSNRINCNDGRRAGNLRALHGA